MLTLKEVAEQEEKWRKMASYIGASPQVLDDVIQNLYLKLGEIQQAEGSLERLCKEGKLNTLYVFKILQTLIVDNHRHHKRLLYGVEHFQVSQDPEKWEYAYQELMEAVGDCIDGLEEYDLWILELHFIYGHSMRKLSQMTGVSLRSIFHRIKTIKSNIKLDVHHKYEKYIQEKADSESHQGARRLIQEVQRQGGDH